MARTPVKITLHKSELIYDIQNTTMLTARSRKDGTNFEQMAHMQANDDDENLNQIMRYIGNAWTSLLNATSEYADLQVSNYARTDATSETETTWQTYGNDPGIHTTTDKLFDSTGQLHVYLLMPENFNTAAKEQIATAMHQYIVNTTLGQWFTITNPTESASYFTLAQANLTQLREACSRRRRPTRQSV